MTDRQKDRIRQMRADGCGYRKIAQKLGISENTVKSFCQRKGLGAEIIKMAVPSADGDKGICPCCGAEVRQNSGRNAKKLCLDKCHNKWWNSHLALEFRQEHPHQRKVKGDTLLQKISLQKSGKRTRGDSVVLCGGKPRGNHPARNMGAGAGRVGMAETDGHEIQQR